MGRNSHYPKQHSVTSKGLSAPALKGLRAVGNGEELNIESHEARDRHRMSKWVTRPCGLVEFNIEQGTRNVELRNLHPVIPAVDLLCSNSQKPGSPVLRNLIIRIR